MGGQHDTLTTTACTDQVPWYARADPVARNSDTKQVSIPKDFLVNPATRNGAQSSSRVTLQIGQHSIVREYFVLKPVRLKIDKKPLHMSIKSLGRGPKF